MKLCRLVTSTLADGTPAGTGLLSSSTSSARHMSAAKRSTDPPGSLWPTSPSVDTNESITGTANACSMMARSAAVSTSAFDTTDRGVMLSLPASCSRASSANLDAYPIRAGGCAALSRATISVSGSVTGAGISRTGGPEATAAGPGQRLS